MATDEGDGVEFRDWLLVELRARRMSLRQLAHRSGLSVSTVSRIVRGERRPTLRTAVRLGRVVGANADESTITRFFGGATADTLDPVRGVERALRGDGELDDDGVRRTMQVYLTARGGSRSGARRQRRV
jgi:transcriptional regulator with XRE-family HTH domain